MAKQTSIIFGIGALIIVLGGVLMYAEPDEHPNADTSTEIENVLTADRPLHDFGTISMKDGKVKTTFKIKNDKAEVIQMQKLYTSCMCTEASLKINGGNLGPFGMPGHGAFPTFKEVLEPNQEVQIEVEFDPNAHGPSGVGVIERMAILEGPKGQLVSVGIRANVTP